MKKSMLFLFLFINAANAQKVVFSKVIDINTPPIGTPFELPFIKIGENSENIFINIYQKNEAFTDSLNRTEKKDIVYNFSYKIDLNDYKDEVVADNYSFVGKKNEPGIYYIKPKSFEVVEASIAAQVMIKANMIKNFRAVDIKDNILIEKENSKVELEEFLRGKEKENIPRYYYYNLGKSVKINPAGSSVKSMVNYIFKTYKTEKNQLLDSVNINWGKLRSHPITTFMLYNFDSNSFEYLFQQPTVNAIGNKELKEINKNLYYFAHLNQDGKLIDTLKIEAKNNYFQFISGYFEKGHYTLFFSNTRDFQRVTILKDKSVVYTPQKGDPTPKNTGYGQVWYNLKYGYLGTKKFDDYIIGIRNLYGNEGNSTNSYSVDKISLKDTTFSIAGFSLPQGEAIKQIEIIDNNKYLIITDLSSFGDVQLGEKVYYINNGKFINLSIEDEIKKINTTLASKISKTATKAPVVYLPSIAAKYDQKSNSIITATNIVEFHENKYLITKHHGKVLIKIFKL